MIFFAEIHQPSGRFLLEMKDIQSRFHIIGRIECRAKLRCMKHLSCCLKLSGAFDSVIYRLRLSYDIFKKFAVLLLCFASGFVQEIFFQLFNIGTHFFRIRHTLVLCIAVYLNDVFQKSNERLRIHNHMMTQEIHTIESVRCVNHDNFVHR